MFRVLQHSVTPALPDVRALEALYSRARTFESGVDAALASAGRFVSASTAMSAELCRLCRDLLPLSAACSPAQKELATVLVAASQHIDAVFAQALRPLSEAISRARETASDSATAAAGTEHFRAQAQQCNAAIERLNRRHEAFQAESGSADAARQVVLSAEAAEVAFETAASDVAEYCAARERIVAELSTGLFDALALQAGSMRTSLDDCASAHARVRDATQPPPLEKILGNEPLRAAFLAFAGRHSCAESVWFLLDVAEFKKLPPGPAKAGKFGRIVGRFIAPGSQHEVNIDATARDALVALAQPPVSPGKVGDEVFVRVEREIATLLAQNLLLAFAKSKDYHDAKKANAPTLFRRELRTISQSFENLLRNPIGVVTFRNWLEQGGSARAGDLRLLDFYLAAEQLLNLRDPAAPAAAGLIRGIKHQFITGDEEETDFVRNALLRATSGSALNVQALSAAQATAMQRLHGDSYVTFLQSSQFRTALELLDVKTASPPPPALYATRAIQAQQRRRNVMIGAVRDSPSASSTAAGSTQQQAPGSPTRTRRLSITYRAQRQSLSQSQLSQQQQSFVTAEPSATSSPSLESRQRSVTKQERSDGTHFVPLALSTLLSEHIGREWFCRFLEHDRTTAHLAKIVARATDAAPVPPKVASDLVPFFAAFKQSPLFRDYQLACKKHFAKLEHAASLRINIC